MDLVVNYFGEGGLRVNRCSVVCYDDQHFPLPERTLSQRSCGSVIKVQDVRDRPSFDDDS